MSWNDPVTLKQVIILFTIYEASGWVTRFLIKIIKDKF